MFLIYRISVLSKYNKWTLTPLYLLAFIQLGFGTGGGIKSMLPQTVGHLACTSSDIQYLFYLLIISFSNKSAYYSFRKIKMVPYYFPKSGGLQFG